MRLLIPPNPLDLINCSTCTLEEFRIAEQASYDWKWKWKREALPDSSGICQQLYGKQIPDVLEPHEYDLLDYFSMRKKRFAHITQESFI